MVGYAELHCHTNFSFLDGASHPEELAEEAHRLGLAGLAVTDHDGFYGVVRFAVAAQEVGLPTVFGAELTLGIEKPPNGTAEIAGEHVLILAEGPAGYAALARTISEAQLRGEKGAPKLSFAQLAEAASTRPGWFTTTGCRKGLVPAALVRDGPAAAQRALEQLIAAFGRDRVLVELWDHGDPMDRPRNDALALLAARTGVEVIATNNVHYATPDRRKLATALAAIRSRRSLDELDGWLPATPFAHLRSAAEQERRFARYPGAVERTVDIAAACAFDLKVAVPNLPDYPVPDGHTDMSWLRELTRRGAAVYYPRTHEHYEQAMRQIDYELGVIEQLGFPGYFLLLHDIVEFCRTHEIYCQGRGSAANSAVCYALGVTKADAVALGLLFERFLSTERDGPPDIDLDIEHQRREEVIQYVYEKYGRDRAAQVANVITYRPKSALREMAKVAGLSPGHADAITRWIDRWRSREGAFDDFRESEDAPPVPELVLELADQVQDFPRHLGIHSGGMVMADRPLVECCPVEWARMENRSVLQWDKDDCAAAGLVKFDLLGLGMLTMLHLAVDLVREHEDLEIDLATIPQEAEVYALLCAADTIGVFQVESRAQMATLPRLRPEKFYDLVVEVALIRPGPIQGGSVHPYLRRRNGEEEVTYPHPILEPCLRKTLGVPLFQEQLMQMAIDAAGLLARRGRPAAPGDGLEAVEGAHGADARPADGGHGRAGHHRRDRRGDRAQARGVRELRVPREPLGVVRVPRVRELVDQAAPPRRVRVRVAERAADGLLLAAHVGARRPPARGGGARSVHRAVATRLHARTPLRARTGRSGIRSPGGTPTRRSTRCASGSGTCAGSRARCSTASTRSGRGSRSTTWRTSPAGPRRRSTRWRRSRPRARSRASTSTAGPASGPRARCATPGPSTCRTPRWGWRRPRSRG